MSITENKERVGRFTSSKIHLLVKSGRAKKDKFTVQGYSYIEAKRYERKLKKSIDIEKYSRAMAWGKFLEMYVFSLIGLEYKIDSLSTVIKNEYWAGSTDLLVGGIKVADIKCYEPLKFCKYSEALMRGDIELLKKNFEQEYWQLVSNAIINKTPKAEAICFMPYESELEEIRKMADNYDGADQWKYRFIVESPKSELAYMPNDSEYKNINTFEFEVPQEDKDFLTQRVEDAVIELLKD